MAERINGIMKASGHFSFMDRFFLLVGWSIGLFFLVLILFLFFGLALASLLGWKGYLVSPSCSLFSSVFYLF